MSFQHLRLSMMAALCFAALTTICAQAPTISSVSPTSGAAGSTVTITGTNFNATAASNAVFFGGMKATVTAASATSLSVTVPAGADDKQLSVVNIVTGLSAVSARQFVVTHTDTTVSFTRSSYPLVKAGSNIVASGDIDGDGKQDVISTNASEATVSIFRSTSALSTATGPAFAAKVDFTVSAVAGGMRGVDVVDIDGDGKLDVITYNGSATSGQKAFSVLRNTSTSGSVSFAAYVGFLPGIAPSTAAIADIDLDGKPDIALVGSNGAMTLYRNTSVPGTPNFSSSGVLFYNGGGTGTQSTSLAFGDMDGDDKPDAVIQDGLLGRVAVLRNTSSPGNFSFASAVGQGSNLSNGKTCLGDLDRDGKLDIVIGNPLTGGMLSVVKNNSTVGTISLATAQSVAAGISAGAISFLLLSDMNSDGKLDIVATNGDMISVIPGTSTPGTISFGPKWDLDGFNPYSICVVDLNNNSKPDIVIGDVATSIGTMFNITLAAAPTISSISPASGPIGTSVVFTGANHGVQFSAVQFGAISAAVTGANGTTGVTATVPTGAGYQGAWVWNTVSGLLASAPKPFNVTFPTNGVLSFSARSTFTTGTLPGALAVADLNGDRKADIITANGTSNNISLFQSNSSSGLVNFNTKVDSAAGTKPSAVAWGDINGDGKQDIVVANYTSNTISIFRNASKAGLPFTGKQNIATDNGPISLALTDIDNDGRLDLVVSNALANTVSVFRNTGRTGTIVFAAKLDFPVGTTPGTLAVNDLDGDGKIDIAVVNNGSNTVSVLRNTSSAGSISFATKTDYTTGSFPAGIALADLDGDDKSDMVVVNQNANTLSFFRNTSVSGILGFTAKADTATGLSPRAVAITDLDGDGRPDIAAANFSNGTVSLYRNTSVPGTISLAGKSDLNAGSSPAALVINDIDNDGKPDIVATNANANTISVFRNAGVVSQFITNPVTKSVKAATSASFFVKVNSASPFTYQWQVSTNLGVTYTNISNSAVYSGATTDTLTINEAPQSFTSYRYRCTIIFNGSVTATSTAASLTVSGYSLNPANISTFCPGDSLVLSSPSGAATHQWYKNGVAIAGATSANFAVKEAGSYSDSGYSASGIAMPGIAKKILINTPPQVSMTNTAGAACVGTAALQLSSNNSLFSKIDWYRDTILIRTRIEDTPVIVAGGNGAGSAANQFSGSSGFFVDKDKNIYVADYSNHRIQKWAAGATSGITVAGGNGAGSAANQLNFPMDVFVDPQGNMYIADEQNNRVQKWAPGATSGVTVAGGKGAGSAASQVAFPQAVFVDSIGNLYVSQLDQNRVQRFAPGDTVGVIVAGGRGAGSAANQLNVPVGIFVDAAANVYVADGNNNRVQKWAPGDTAGVTVAGGNGAGLAANQLPASSWGVWVDKAGNVYTSGGSRVQKWAPGSSIGVIVAGNNNFLGPMQLRAPIALELDDSSNIYVIEQSNNRIQKWPRKAIDMQYKPDTSGVYKAVVTDYNTCVSTSSSIVVYPQPATPLVTANKPTTICEGDTLILHSSSPSGNQWYKNGIAITGAIDTLYKVTAGGVYTDTVKLGGGCMAGSSAMSITVAALPAVPAITPVGATTFCAGDSLLLQSTSADSYQWYKDGQLIAGATDPTYIAKTTGSYTVVVANGSGCTRLSQSLQVTASAAPATPAITSQGNTNFCNGSSVVLSAPGAPLGQTWSFQWFKNDTLIGGATAPDLTAISSGSYSVKVSTGIGCSSRSAAKTVSSQPLPQAVITNGYEVTLEGAGLTLSANTGTGLTYRWFRNDTLINNQVSSSLLAGSTGSYTVEVTNAGGCSNRSLPTNVTGITAGQTGVGGGCADCPGSRPILLSDGTNDAGLAFCAGGSVILSLKLSSGQTFLRWKDANNNTVGSALSYTATSTGNYAAEVEAAGVVKSSKPVAILVNALPVVAVTASNASICSGQSSILTASGASRYQWIAGENLIPGAAAAVYMAKTANSYSVKGTDLNGCTSFSSQTVLAVNPSPQSPVISAAGSTTICSGSNVLLTSSLATGNQWYKDGVSINDATGQMYQATASGKYTSGATSENGCIASSNEIAVTVNQTPSTPSINAAGALVFCKGGSVVLRSSTAATGQSYQWNLDNIAVNGAVSDSFTVINSGSYTVSLVSDAGCAANSVPVAVTVNALPDATVTNTYSIGSDNAGTVTLSAVTGAGLSYRWFLGGNVISNETAAQLAVTQAGNYTAELTDGNGCTITSAPANVASIPSSSNNGNVVLCKGNNVNLSATLAAGESVVRWKDGNGNTVAAGIGTYTATTAGSYAAEIFNGDDIVTTRPVTVVVNDLPSVSIATDNNITALCSGGSLTLTATGSGMQWYLNDVPVPNATTNSYAASLGGNYSVRVTDNNNCSAVSEYKTITVFSAPPIPVVSQSRSETFCAGDSITLVSSAVSGNSWYRNGTPVGEAAQYVAKESGVYYVTATNSNGCSSNARNITVQVNALPVVPTVAITGAAAFCSGDSVLLSSSASSGNQWYKDNNLIDNATNASYKASVAGNYVVTVVDNNGCKSSSAATAVTVFDIPQTPVLTAAGTITFCVGSTATLNSSASAGNQWYKDGVLINGAIGQSYDAKQTGKYTVILTNANGCSATSNSITVTVNPLPVLGDITGLASVCSGARINYTNTTAGGTWSASNTAVADISAAGVLNALSAGTAIIGYSYTNSNGCSAAVTKTITVNALPSQPSITGIGVACEGTSISLSGTITGGQWGVANSSILTISSAGVVSAIAAGTTTVTYQVINAAGCQRSTDKTFKVNALPVISVQSSLSSISRGRQVQLTLTAPAGATVAWTPAATLDNPTSLTPKARPLENTTTYTAAVTDTNGCVSNKSVSIQTIEDLTVITPPILFTPNGDGINDRFVIENIDAYPQNTLQVFDKTGKLIYQATNYHNEWDGLKNSRPLTNDTYFYVLRVKETIVKKGAVTILVKK